MWTPVHSTLYTGYGKFFRLRLLALRPEQVEQWIDDMEKQVNEIKKDALKTCWNMRGGLSYDDALKLSYQERKMITELVKSNLETTRKSGLPYF